MVYLSTNIEGGGAADYMVLITSTNNNYSQYSQRFFECKTCNRQFSSFQALGGHRASHKKPRILLMEADNAEEELRRSPPKLPKIHKCSVCGLEFAIGQALGGHMRRHRDGGATMNDQNRPPPPLDLSTPVHVMRKSNSRRVVCLDLNLTPLENDVEFQLGHKLAPAPLWGDSIGAHGTKLIRINRMQRLRSNRQFGTRIRRLVTWW